MFIDEAIITVEGGKGGDGAVTFFPGIKTGPSGGDGGHGGNVFVHGDREKVDLYQYVTKKKYKAADGKKGENFKRKGPEGEDLVITVPTGTVFIDRETKDAIEVNDEETLHLLARGGKGGKGNAKFATSTRQAPKFAQPGLPGEVKDYKVVLKLIADFGLIGLPNAGKSSLLNELTAARAKIGAYPFTTIEPNLGVFNRFIIADIPGLIEGASKGKGLGYKFLKHIEKVKVLLHCISLDSADVIADYKTVMNELKVYNKDLIGKKQIILLTKTDLVDEKVIKAKTKELSQYVSDILPISIFNPTQFAVLQKKLLSFTE